MTKKRFPIGKADAQAEAEFVEFWNADCLPRLKHRAEYAAAGLPLAALLQTQWATFDDLCVLYAGLRPDGQERLVQRLAPWWTSLRNLEDKIRKRVVSQWMQSRGANGLVQNIAGWDRSIWLKDFAYGAGNNPIIVEGAGADTIDGQATFSIVEAGDLIRLYPLTDLSGWFVG